MLFMVQAETEGQS